MNEHIQILPDKCRACHRCEMACIAAHHGIDMKEAMKRKDEFAASVHVVKTDDFKTSTRCHQCEHAPCVNVCPAHALQQEADGSITFRHELCLGCHMCEAACPYGAVAFDSKPTRDDQGGNLPVLHAHAEAVRCDLCRSWRAANGKSITACMEACPVQCLVLVRTDGSILEAPKPEKKPAPKPAAVEGAAAPEKSSAAPEKPAAEKTPPKPAADAATADRPASTPQAAPAAKTPEAPSKAADVPGTPNKGGKNDKKRGGKH